MKRKDFLKNEYDRFFARVEELDFTGTKQITAFVKWCFDNHFLDGITEEDLYYLYNDNNLFLPTMIHENIMINLVYYKIGEKPHCYIGIDPADCFNCVQDRSIVMVFPITSKRVEAHFYKIINTLLDKKSKLSKEWFSRTNKTWSGPYLTNK